MNILFVCKFNRFRSKVAEGFFNKYNKNQANKAKSAGIIIGSPVSEEIKESAREFGLKINGKLYGLSTDLLKWQEMTVIVASDVPEEIFKENNTHGKKLVVWKIDDTPNDKKEVMRQIISEIEARVKMLIKELS